MDTPTHADVKHAPSTAQTAVAFIWFGMSLLMVIGYML